MPSKILGITLKLFPKIDGNEEQIKEKVDQLLVDEQYNSIGTSTFSTGRIRKRMDRALEIFSDVA